MAPPIPTTEPTQIVAGDTVNWTRTLADYLSTDSWVLSYQFRLQEGTGTLTVTAATLGTGYAATITAAQSAPLPAGLWRWDAYVTKAAERYRVDSGTLTVAPNLAALTGALDLRSPAKRAYDNAIQIWEAVSAGQNVEIDGRTFTQHNLTDLIVYVDRCKADYQRELDAEKLANTGFNPRKIYARLNRV